VSGRHGTDNRDLSRPWLRLLRSLSGLAVRWLRQPARRVRVVSASTAISLGLVVLLVLTGEHGPYWFRAEPRPDPGITLPPPEGTPSALPGPDVTLTVGPERPGSPTATPTSPPTAPSATPPGPGRPNPPGQPNPGQPNGPGKERQPNPAAARCDVTFARSGSWEQGYVATVSLRNLASSAVNGWTLAWRFGGDQRIRNLWNGTVSQRGRQVLVRDAGWNAAVAPGASVQFGFEVSAAPANTDPADFTLNGTNCR